MDLKLSEEQRMLVAAVRRFIREEIVPLEPDLDPDAYELPKADHDRLVAMVKDMGLYQMDVPEEFGGPGVDLRTRVLLTEEMSQHRAGLYVPCYGVFGSAGLAQLYEATEEQKQRYLYPMLRGEKRGFFGLTEPSGGSDPARAIRTRAVKEGSDWIINGSKVFISGADRAHFGLVFARTDAEKGRGGITCFIVDTDMKGFHVRRVVHTLRSSHYATELQFEDLRVPAANILGEVNKGFAIANDRLSRQRIPYAAACIGVAVKAQELAIDYARQRETFGAPLATRQAVQWMIADMAKDTHAARLMVRHAARLLDAGRRATLEASFAKCFASDAAVARTADAVQIHGGSGYIRGVAVERLYRDAKITQIYEGTNQIQRMIMARQLLA